MYSEKNAFIRYLNFIKLVYKICLIIYKITFFMHCLYLIELRVSIVHISHSQRTALTQICKCIQIRTLVKINIKFISFDEVEQ